MFRRYLNPFCRYLHPGVLGASDFHPCLCGDRNHHFRCNRNGSGHLLGLRHCDGLRKLRCCCVASDVDRLCHLHEHHAVHRRAGCRNCTQRHCNQPQHEGWSGVTGLWAVFGQHTHDNFVTTASLNGNGASQPITIYGQIPAGEYVTPGAYTDTITVTVTY